MKKKRMTLSQRAWCMGYEKSTTFEPLMDDFLEGNETFEEAAKGSIEWFRDWANETARRMEDHLPTPKGEM